MPYIVQSFIIFRNNQTGFYGLVEISAQKPSVYVTQFGSIIKSNEFYFTRLLSIPHPPHPSWCQCFPVCCLHLALSSSSSNCSCQMLKIHTDLEIRPPEILYDCPIFIKKFGLCPPREGTP